MRLITPSVRPNDRESRSLIHEVWKLTSVGRRGLSAAGATRQISASGGYTLIEMQIASVLVAALMSVVWGMMSMYNSYLTAGQSQAVEQQLIRSVVQLIENDLQSVAVTDTNPKIVPSLEFSDLSLTEMQQASFALDPFADNAALTQEEPSVFAGLATGNTLSIPGGVSLVGNGSSVKLSIAQRMNDDRPLLNLGSPFSGTSIPAGDVAVPNTAIASETVRSIEDSTSVEGVAPEVEEYQTVIWQFQAPGMITGTQSLRAGLYRIQTESLSLQTALNQQESLLENQGPESETSVDRMTLETLLYPPVAGRQELSGGNGSSERQEQQVPKFDLVPEVVSCRFEYFNGSAWASTWNSDQQQGLPVAIRLSLRLVKTEDLEKLAAIFGEASSQSSPLDDAIDSRLPSTAASTVSQNRSTDDSPAEPLATIRTRQIERVILLQPVTGPMPEPGANGTASQLEATL